MARSTRTITLAVLVVLVVGFAIHAMFTRLDANIREQDRVRKVEAMRLEAQLRERLMKAVPVSDLTKHAKPDEFIVLTIGTLNEKSAELVLDEPATGMTCRGVVYFINGSTGGHFDELHVSDCRPRQPTRVFSSGVRQRQME